MPRPATSNGVTQLGPNRYRWRVMVNGVRYTGIAPTAAAARLARAAHEINAGGVPNLDPTVRELLEAHIAHVGRAHTTLKNYRWAFDFLPSPFLDRRAADVTAPIVAALWRQMVADDAPPHRLIKTANLCSTAWQDALLMGVVASNPWRTVPPPTPPSSREIVPPNPEDVQALIRSATGAFKVWVMLAAYTGARGGEVCGLQWRDVDLEAGTILIRRNVTRDGAERSTKTGRKGHRRIILDDDIIDALRDLKEQTCPSTSMTTADCSTSPSRGSRPRTSPSRLTSSTTSSAASHTSRSTATTTRGTTKSGDRSAPSSPASPWIFLRGDGEVMRPDGAAKRLALLCRTVGVDVSPHDLRHFAATQALGMGVPVPDVAHMLGDNPQTVLRTYAHHVPANQRRIVQAIAQRVRDA